MRISDWSSDVCSSDLDGANQAALSGFRIAILPACRSTHIVKPPHHVAGVNVGQREGLRSILGKRLRTPANSARREWLGKSGIVDHAARLSSLIAKPGMARLPALTSFWPWRSEEHTSELQSLMRISYAVFCL